MPPIPPPDVYTLWTSLDDAELTVQKVGDILDAVKDDLWVTAACYDRMVENIDVERELIKIGLERTVNLEESITAALGEQVDGNLEEYLRTHERERQICAFRLGLLKRSDLVETYAAMSTQWNSLPSNKEEKVPDPWGEDDHWGDTNEVPQEPTPTLDPPIRLTDFLFNHLLDTAFLLASSLQFSSLETLISRHAPQLVPFRFSILESIPEHAQPSDFRTLLPANDFDTDVEVLLPSNPGRQTRDWVEAKEFAVALDALHTLDPLISVEPSTSIEISAIHQIDMPLSSEQLSTWYKSRVSDIEESSGLVDIALNFVQNGAANNIPGLDHLGEELSLLSRLVYDAPEPASGWSDDWSLRKWRSVTPPEVIQAYLAGSTPTSVVQDIRRLVMPYLFVLEAQKERAGQPDPELPARLLYDYVLGAPLNIAAAIFDASKPIAPQAQRIIRSDEDLARVALACLYGSNNTTEWATMSAIFECLPAWDKDEDAQDDDADETLEALAEFVVPSTSKPRVSPKDLFTFFKPLPQPSLSRALDILDTHLWSGDILARWNVPAPLTWFLRSAEDIREQRAWATRMSRRAGDAVQDEELENEDEWQALLDDMIKLVDDGSAPGSLKGAFSLLSRGEVVRIFFGGLLSTGKFSVASSLLDPMDGSSSPLDPETIEEICLTASREFYDNASSGNLYHGEMKLAYDCLNVAPPGPAIASEREFIEATSRICSFHVVSRPGIPITPLEIRLVKDRLGLVGRVLSSTEDAYKHSELILDLTRKLGYRNDVPAEVKVLAMLTTAALQAEDFTKAEETANVMVERVRGIAPSATSPGDHQAPSTSSPAIKEAMEVCWQTCFQLGKQSEFDSIGKKLRLLGHALEFCPAENIVDVLTVWRKIESEQIDILKGRSVARKSAAREQQQPRKKRRHSSEYATLPTLPTRLQDLDFGLGANLPTSGLAVGQDAAAAAARTLGRVAANLPFSVRGRLLGGEEPPRRPSSAGSAARSQSPATDVSSHASRALARGVGWLIGVGDDDDA